MTEVGNDGKECGFLVDKLHKGRSLINKRVRRSKRWGSTTGPGGQVVLTGSKIRRGKSKRETEGSHTQSRERACSLPASCFLFLGRSILGDGGSDNLTSTAHAGRAQASRGFYSCAGVYILQGTNVGTHRRRTIAPVAAASWQIPGLARRGAAAGARHQSVMCEERSVSQLGIRGVEGRDEIRAKPPCLMKGIC